MEPATSSEDDIANFSAGGASAAVCRREENDATPLSHAKLSGQPSETTLTLEGVQEQFSQLKIRPGTIEPEKGGTPAHRFTQGLTDDSHPSEVQAYPSHTTVIPPHHHAMPHTPQASLTGENLVNNPEEGNNASDFAESKAYHFGGMTGS